MNKGEAMLAASAQKRLQQAEAEPAAVRSLCCSILTTNNYNHHHHSLLCRGTLILGFEQATKYTVYDQDGNAVSCVAVVCGCWFTGWLCGGTFVWFESMLCNRHFEC